MGEDGEGGVPGGLGRTGNFENQGGRAKSM